MRPGLSGQSLEPCDQCRRTRGGLHQLATAYRLTAGQLDGGLENEQRESVTDLGAAGTSSAAAISNALIKLPRQLRAQPQHRLCVQLRDARLGDAEHLSDLPQGQVLVVVE